MLWVNFFRKKTSTNSTFEEISVADAIQRAEFLVIRKLQQEHFHKDIEFIKIGN
jgi:hypothetical protein